MDVLPRNGQWGACGEYARQSLLTEEQVVQIKTAAAAKWGLARKRHGLKEFAEEWSRRCGVTSGCIRSVVSGSTWMHVRPTQATQQDLPQ